MFYNLCVILKYKACVDASSKYIVVSIETFFEKKNFKFIFLELTR